MSRQLTLYDYWMALYRHKWAIAIVVLSSFAFTYGLSNVLPPVYEAKTTFYIPKESAKILYTGQDQSDLVQTPALPVPDEKTAGTSIGILKSKANARRVHNLFPDRSVEELMKNTDIVLGSEYLTEVYVRDRDPNTAAAVANAYVTAYEEFQSELMVERSERTRKVLEQQLGLVSNQLTESKLRIRQFEGRRDAGTAVRQSRDSKAALDKARINLAIVKRSIAKLNAQLSSEKKAVVPDAGLSVNSALAKDIPGRLAPTEGMLQHLAALTDNERSLETKIRSLEDTLNNLDAHTTSLPVKFIEHEGLTQKISYLTGLKENLEKNLAEAKLQQKYPPPTLVVAERAIPPEKPAFPIPFLNAFVASVLGLVIGCYYALFLEYLRRLRQEHVRSNIDWKPNIRVEKNETRTSIL
jgi:uncharacterized protein involved in exopolysaccharide biosynthesis